MFRKILPQIIALLFLAGFVAYAWTEPASAPPGGNVPSPINVGPAAQTKQGNLTLGGILKVEGNILDKLGNIIYNATAGKIERARLPFEQGDITSDVDTNTYDAGYFDVSNLIPANIKKGITFGRGGQVGTVEPMVTGDSAAEGTAGWNYHSGWGGDGCMCWWDASCSGFWFAASCADYPPAYSERDPRGVLNWQVTSWNSCWQGAPGNCKFNSFPGGNPYPYALVCSGGFGLSAEFCPPGGGGSYCAKGKCLK